MNWEQIVKDTHEAGLKTLVETGRIPFLLRPFDERGAAPVPDLVLVDGLDDHARGMINGPIALIFRLGEITAALMQSDTMQVKSDVFARYFRLPENLPYDEFQKEYLRILNADYGGTMANLPQKLWSEALVTCLKGPKIEPISCFSPYLRLKKDKIVISGTQRQMMAMMNLVPDWWTPVVN